MANSAETPPNSSDSGNHPNQIAAGSSKKQPVASLARNSEKHTAYYSALVAAWIGTKMEKDKSLLTLATGGIGLLVTLLTAVGVNSTRMVFLYGAAFFCFLATIVSVVVILGLNATFIQGMIWDETPKNKSLNILDKIMVLSFIGGIVITITIGISTGIGRINRQENAMKDKVKTTQQVTVDGQKSLSGLEKLHPDYNQGQTGGQTQPSQTPAEGQTGQSSGQPQSSPIQSSTTSPEK